MTKPARKRRNTHHASQHPDAGPTTEALQHSEIVYVQPSRFSSDAPVARRVGMHDRLVDRGRITKPQWEWADRYVRECEVVAGGREGKGDQERVDADGSEPIYDRATAAAAFLRRSDARMSEAQRRLIWDSCVMAYRDGDIAIAHLGLVPHAEVRDDGSPARIIRAAESMAAFGDRVRDRVMKAVVLAVEAGSGIVEGVRHDQTV